MAVAHSLRQRIASQIAGLTGVGLEAASALIQFHSPKPTAAAATRGTEQAAVKPSAQDPGYAPYRLSVELLMEHLPDMAHRKAPDSIRRQRVEQTVSECLTKFQASPDLPRVSAIGSTLQFAVDKPAFNAETLSTALREASTYGSASFGRGKTVVLDFSSPNIAKQFHAGHLRSAIIGNVLRNLYAFLGYKTVAINYLGDWGKQYGLLGVGFQKFGSMRELEENPLQHLFDVYVKINGMAEQNEGLHEEARAYFKLMEQGDPEILKTWARFRSLSVEEYRKMYERLNISFDEYSGESHQHTKVPAMLERLRGKLPAVDSVDSSIAAAPPSGAVALKTEPNGALVADFSALNLGPAVLAKANESSTYLTRDIVAAVDRWERFRPHLMLYVVGPEQSLHFEQLFALLRSLDYKECAAACHHVSFGKVQGMSTRRGNVVLLSELLEEAERRMEEHIRSKKLVAELVKQNQGGQQRATPLPAAEDAEDELRSDDRKAIARMTALSAIVVQDLKSRRNKGYKFDWDLMLQNHGATGPYLQYAHARLCSLERKSAHIPLTHDIDHSLLREPEAQAIIEQIAAFPFSLERAHASMEPCLIVDNLLQLSQAISSAHTSLRVIGKVDPARSQARKLLFHCAKVTLANGLRILGLHPLERM